MLHFSYLYIYIYTCMYVYIKNVIAVCARENGGIFHNVREGICLQRRKELTFFLYTFMAEDWAVHNSAPNLLENYLNSKKYFKTTWK